MRIDLNADLGEGVTDDEGLLAVVTSANLACGFHAGDEETMRAVCTTAARTGVVIGAQVSYDDREHFGRRHLDVEPEVLTGGSTSRCGCSPGSPTSAAPGWPTSSRTARSTTGSSTTRSRPAAVLRGQRDAAGARAARRRRSCDSRSEAGRRTVREGFPDRGYTDDGRLVPRDQPGALVRGAPRDRAPTRSRWPPTCESLCVHGDSPGRWRRPGRCGRRWSPPGTTYGPGEAELSLVHRWTSGLVWKNRPSLWRERPWLWSGRTILEHVRGNPCQCPSRRVDISHRIPPGRRSGSAKLILSRARA